MRTFRPCHDASVDDAPTIQRARFDDLARTFRQATDLEVGFWQMGLDAAGRN